MGCFCCVCLFKKKKKVPGTAPTLTFCTFDRPSKIWIRSKSCRFSAWCRSALSRTRLRKVLPPRAHKPASWHKLRPTRKMVELENLNKVYNIIYNIYIYISLDSPNQSLRICKNCKVLAMPPPLLSPWQSAARCTAMLCNQRHVLRTWPGEASMFTYCSWKSSRNWSR